MTRGNRLLECPNCEEPQLTVVRSDVDENNVGLRRYQCEYCRNYFTTLEVLFVDDRGNPDSFNQLALNRRIYDREKYHKRKGNSIPRRPLKATDQIMVYPGEGSVTLRYKRNKQERLVWSSCARGHAFDAENTYINKTTGSQQCKTCRRINQQRWAALHPERRRASSKAYDDAHREQKRLRDAARRQARKELVNDIPRNGDTQDYRPRNIPTQGGSQGIWSGLRAGQG